MSENSRRPSRGPMGRGRMSGEKAKDFSGAVKKLLRYMSKYKIRLIGMMIFAIAGTVFNIVGPKILGKATTELFNGLVAKVNGTGGIDFDKIGRILLWTLGLYLCSAAFSFIQGFIMTGISNDVSYSLRKDISGKMNRLPMKYYESRTYGEVLSRITNDVDTLQQGLNQSITQLITSVTTLIGVFIMMLSINVWMTLCALLILPCSMFIIGKVMKRSQKYFQQQQKYLGDVNGQVEEVYAGQNIVKAFNKEEAVMATFEETNKKLYESGWKSQFFSGMMMPIMQFVGNIGYVMVALLGGFMTIKGAIEVGDIQSFFQYIRNFTQPVQQIAQVTNMMQSAAAASERVFEFLEEEEEEQTAEHPVKLENGVEGRVTFEHVSFGYRPDQIIIKDFSEQVHPGQKIAIVGPTGCGKTTFINLLMRFYDVTGGTISIDGHPINEISRHSLRSSFGMVLQDTWIKNGTVRDNINIGKPDATDGEIIEAAKRSHSWEFIRRLPNGLDSQLKEDSLSQGEKQLLCITRVMLCLPPMLILDEATSSIDTRTELMVQEAFDRLMEGRTSFIVAHRLSTIRNADEILVMKDGSIIEQGSHDSLMAKGGFYQNLYNSQFVKVSE